ncbi:DUF986 family protein [Celerinatantimonas yamalensis]|uniref:UPF0266 membrane protein ABUE30_07490 n=1 Tax=Celerinatantimonas yamalensis TaxID=559956 RepID=A0ABW9G780_9GAMM
MSVTDWVLFGFIILLFGYAIYDEFIMPRRHGKTILHIPLLRKTRLDSLIFVALIAILLYRNMTNGGRPFTTYLLVMVALLSVYLAYIRQPKLLFKPSGFFFANAFIDYQRIKSMNLTEDGVLVFGLDSGNLPIELHRIDDLGKITELFSRQETQPMTKSS